MYRCQLHNRCSFTCFKGSFNNQSCRLALPSDYSELLRFVQLREVADVNGKMLMPTKDPHIDPPPEDAPIPPKDPRLIICKPKKVSEIDTQLVNGNISISASIRCNTCIEFISTPGNAQGALFYISNYMKKAIDKTSKICPLVHSANIKRATSPSPSPPSPLYRFDITNLQKVQKVIAQMKPNLFVAHIPLHLLLHLP